jgi:WD40 repeat protein
VTSDHRRAISGSWDESLHLWDLESGQLLEKLIGHTGGVVAVATSSDGRLAVSGSLDKTLRVWDLNDGKELVTCIVDVQVTACAMSHDSRTIVSGDRFGRVHFLRLEGVD